MSCFHNNDGGSIVYNVQLFRVGTLKAVEYKMLAIGLHCSVHLTQISGAGKRMLLFN